MILSKIFEILRINSIKSKLYRFVKKYNLTLVDIIIDENLSNRLYNSNSHIGKRINLFEARDLLEPNLNNIFRSKL